MLTLLKALPKVGALSRALELRDAVYAGFFVFSLDLWLNLPARVKREKFLDTLFCLVVGPKVKISSSLGNKVVDTKVYLFILSSNHRETLYVLLKGKFEKVWTKNLSHRKMEGDILTDGLISLGSIKKLIRHNILACSPKEP